MSHTFVVVVAVLTALVGSCVSSWRPFALDRVIGPDIGQEGMFEEVEHVAASVVDGFRCCIFAYGITGGGKTYTMQGPPSGACLHNMVENAEVAMSRCLTAHSSVCAAPPAVWRMPM